MHKLVVLYPHPVDPEAFTAYYERTHLPLAAQLPGMLDWRYSTRVRGAPESPYFAVFEADFPDAETFAAAMDSPQGRAVRADVPRYASGGAVVLDYPVAER
ncbi:EthD family reductase [Sciscionella sediminilitoris]|uniref:EthD family reductase n=1 Tax=Sciscionella sediminilitoris TaxID=1445613 RepID=UPI0004DF1E4B|nr:EthD family reductase [Sciscionella sp. SE31]